MARHGSRSLALWSWSALALLAAHDVTHVLDDGVGTRLAQLALVGLPQWFVLAAVMAVILRGDEDRRRIAALVLGIAMTVGFTVIHLLPFSPAGFWDLQPSAVSWVLVWVPVFVGVRLAALAWRRSERGDPTPVGAASAAHGGAERYDRRA